ncbi:MAG: hypothetical protein KDJ69_12075 [Nitratireductor sp.]|nr:hypothetical protein [Nitratireductor sp.]
MSFFLFQGDGLEWLETLNESASTAAAAAAQSATDAEGFKDEAETKAGEADASANAAATSAGQSSASAAAALTSEGNASTSEGNAAADAAAADASKVAALAAANAAGTAQLAAEAARDQAFTAFDNFDDKYLGEKAAEPATDNDGDPLQPGALFYHTGIGLKFWDGAAWVAAYISGAGFLAAANNLSDVNDPDVARGNLSAPSVAEMNAGLAGKSNTGHTHTIANVTGLQANLDSLQTAVDGKAATGHTHTIANVTGLQTALDGKAASAHTHAIANVTGLQAALDGKSATGHTHTLAQISDSGSMAGENDAPSDGNTYARKNGAWEALASEGWTLLSSLATSAGTAINFTGIPTGVREVLILFDDVAVTSGLGVRLGDSGGVETTGYDSYTGNRSSSTSSTTEFDLIASTLVKGVMRLFHMGGNQWMSDHMVRGYSNVPVHGAGDKTLSGALDRVQLMGGTFSGGSCSVFYR